MDGAAWNVVARGARGGDSPHSLSDTLLVEARQKVGGDERELGGPWKERKEVIKVHELEKENDGNKGNLKKPQRMPWVRFGIKSVNQ